MAHTATESFAIQPHNVEANRVETLVPEHLRNNAANLIALLTEYYDYMNEDGIVKGINILNPGSGGNIKYADLLKATDIFPGVEVFDFVPTNYNQQYIKLSEEEVQGITFTTKDSDGNANLVINPVDVYRGLTNSSYFILRMDKADANTHSLYNTWVMAFNDQGLLQCDFFDATRDISLGSLNDDVAEIIFRGNTGGSFKTLDTTTANAFAVGNIDPIALNKTTGFSAIPQKTSLIDFKGIEAKGGHGQGLTIDITTNDGYVVTAIPNTEGHGYRIDDYLEIDILDGAILTIGDVIAAPSNITRRILEEHDIDKTTDDYLGRIQKEIATGIPDAKNLDKNTLYKKIVEYYNTRGSESSIESFFKIFFDEVATVSYPKEFLFKPSDGIYEGSSAVSITKEKYYYKKGYDQMRRIQFPKDGKYDNIRTGTYFVDFEFGDNYEKGYDDATIPSTQSTKKAVIGFTHLFSCQNTGASGLTRNAYQDGGVILEIDANNDLIVKARFGKFASEINATFSNYVQGTSNFPFQEAANESKRRVRLTFSIDARQNYANVWSGVNKGRGSVTAAVSGATNLTLDTSGVTGTIEAGQYVRQQDVEGLPFANSTKVVSYDAGTGALVLDNEVTLSASQLDLEFYHPHFVVGDVKIGINLTGNGTFLTPTPSTSNQNYSEGNDSQGRPINGTYETNLYPAALGSVYLSGNSGVFKDAEENPNGELYFYGFAFVPRIVTDAEAQNFFSNKVVPVDKIIDIDFDNNGSVNLTNKGQSVVVAKAVTGGGNSVTRPDGTSFRPTLQEIPTGLSSTGSEYPRKIQWKNQKGFLSDIMKLHDGNYYQEFSYLIRTNLSSDNWETEFNKLVHPAGMKFFTALYLQLSREREDVQIPPVLDATDLSRWLPILQALTRQTGEVQGVHSPKWQPGWFEYFRSVYLEILLYEAYSAFVAQKQEIFNKRKDTFYDYDNGLKLIGTRAGLGGVSTLSGSAKRAIIESNDDSRTIDEQYIELDGNGTGIKTTGKLEMDSELELSFRMKDRDSEANKGKFIAGTRYRGEDGTYREFSIKGAGKNKVAVTVSDFDSTMEDRAPEVVISGLGTANGTYERSVFTGTASEHSYNLTIDGSTTYYLRQFSNISTSPLAGILSNGVSANPGYWHLYVISPGGTIPVALNISFNDLPTQEEFKNATGGNIEYRYLEGQHPGAGADGINRSELFEAIQVTGTNLDLNTWEHGVKFTDTTVSQETSGDGSGNGGYEFNQAARGHNLIIFKPTTKKYRYFNFDTYGSTVSAGATAEHALHDKIKDADTGDIIILYSYDACSCHVNTVNRHGGTLASPEYDYGSATGYSSNNSDEEGLRWALVRYCGATDRQTTWGRINDATDTTLSDRGFDNALRHRESHVFIGVRKSTAAGDSTRFEERMVERCTVDTGSNRPVTASIQYQAGANLHSSTGKSAPALTKVQLGPFLRDKMLTNDDKNKGLDLSYPCIVDLGNDSNFHTLNVKVNGEVKLDGNIVRSEKEASRPTMVKEINLENYDFTDSFNSLNLADDSSIDLTFDEVKTKFKTHIPRGNSGSLYYDSELNGVVSTGGNRWLELIQNTAIDNADTRFSIEVVLKNIGPAPQRIYVGHKSMGATEFNLSTDRFGTYNYSGASGESLSSNQEKTYTFEIGGYNPPNTPDDGFNDISGNNADAKKFDPIAQKWNLIIISNYSSTGEINRGTGFQGTADNGRALTPGANVPMLLVKKIVIKRVDGEAIEFDGITKNAPDFGIKKITTRMAPFLSAINSAQNNLEELNVGLGTLNREQKLSGIHEVDDTYTDTNLLSAYLPWTPGSGNDRVNDKTWIDNGNDNENLREVTTGIFGQKQVTWKAINGGTTNNNDGGWHSPAVRVDTTKNYRVVMPFKTPSTAIDGRIYLGLRMAHDPSVTNAAGGGEPVGDYIGGNAARLAQIQLRRTDGNNYVRNSSIIAVTTGHTETIIWSKRDNNEYTVGNREPVQFTGFDSSDPVFEYNVGLGTRPINVSTDNKLFYTQQVTDEELAARIAEGIPGYTTADLEAGLRGHRIFTDDTAQTPLKTGSGSVQFVTSFAGDPRILRLAINNAYFYSQELERMPITDSWCYGIFYIQAHQNTTFANGARPTTPNRSNRVPSFTGVYEVSTGNKLTSSVASFAFPGTSTTNLQLRAYQFYNTSATNDVVEFGEPIVEALDGTETPFEDLFSLPKHRVSQYPTPIDISKASLSSQEDVHNFKFNVSENRLFAEEKLNNKHAFELQPITSIAASETSATRSNLVPTGAPAAGGIPTLKDLRGDNDSTALKSGGIKNIAANRDGSGLNLNKNALYAPLQNVKFTISPGSYTTANDGEGAKFIVSFKQINNEYFAVVEVLEGGIKFREGEVVTIPDSNIGNKGAPDLQFTVTRIKPGKIQIPLTNMVATEDSEVVLGLDSAIVKEASELSSGHNVLFDKGKEYEITFDATRIYDYNLPSNLYIGGGNKIGHYIDLTGIAGANNAFGNPHINIGQPNHGDGPHEFSFHSSAEGFARILVAAKNVRGEFRLAHNGHELRLSSTDTNQISIDKIPNKWWKSHGSDQHEVIGFDSPTFDIETNALSTIDVNGQITGDDEERNPGLGDAALFVFETEWLTYGENTVQIYNTDVTLDNAGFLFAEVLPAGTNNGLITEGSNKHIIYMDSNTSNPRIIIDQKIDRTATRALTNPAVAEYDKRYAYAYKLENIKVREKRKIIYNGEFKSIVEDAPEVFVDSINNNALYGSTSYRAIDVSSQSATDGAIAQGGSLEVPSLRIYNDDTTNNQHRLGGTKRTTGQLHLGIPKGNYGALRFTASNQAVHYIDFGSNTTRFPFDEEAGISTFRGNTQYEISGEVFIPSGNSKLQKLQVYAGVNPRKINSATNQFEEVTLVDTALGTGRTTYPVFEYPIGKYQVREGSLAGYGWLDSDVTVIDTKGSWVSFKHKFTTRSTQQNERPVIRIVSNIKTGSNQPSSVLDEYSGNAEGETFFIKNIKIKEGFDTDELPEKLAMNSRREVFVETKDKRDYSLTFNSPDGVDEALILSRVKFGSTGLNTYKIKFNDTSALSSTEFNLADLPTSDENLLASSLPFPVNASTQTASYGRSDINIHTTDNNSGTGPENNTPADLINSPNGFIPLGNPTQIGQGISNSPYTTTYENIGKYDFNPFGNRDVVWEARNTDAAWREITKFNRTNGGSGYVQGTYTNVPFIDTNSPSSTGRAVGVGGKVNFTVNSSGACISFNMQNGGFNYGKDHNATFGIPLTLALGPKYVAANAGTRTNDVGDSPEKSTAAVKGTDNALNTVIGKVDSSHSAQTVINIHNSPATRFNAIKPGQTVSGTGITGNPTVVSVAYSGTRGGGTGTSIPVTLSAAQTLTNLTNLTFTDPTTSILVDGVSGNAADRDIIKVGMKVTGTSIPSNSTVSSIEHSSPSGTRFTLDKQIAATLVDNATLTFEDPFYGLARGTGLVIKGNIQSTSGSDSPLQNKTDLSYFDGGFKTPIIEVDDTKLYRVSVWVKQSDTTFTLDSPHQSGYTLDMGGRKIIRWQGSNDSALATPLEINNGSISSLTGKFIDDFDLGLHDTTSVATSKGLNNDKWLLVVAHIHPTGTDAGSFSNHTDTGVYEPSNTGTKVRTITGTKQGDWIFSPGIRFMQVTALHESNSRSGASEDPVQFYAPRIDIVDGTEPTIQQLTSGEILYKTPANEIQKEIPILPAKSILSNMTKPISDYKHIVEADKFNVKIDETYTVEGEQKTYADMIESKFTPPAGETDTIFTVDFTGKTGNVPIILPLRTTGSSQMNVAVDWGDGTSHIIKNTSDKDLYHIYTNGGGKAYTIRLSGTFQKIQSDGQTSSASSSTATDKATARTNWKTSLTTVYLGNTPFAAAGLTSAFKNCTALTSFITTPGVTNTSACTSLLSLCEGASALKHIDMRGMDTSSCTTFNKAFMLKSYANWSSSGSYTAGDFVHHTSGPIDQVYKSLTGVAGSTGPNTDTTNWEAQPIDGDGTSTHLAIGVKVIGLHSRNIGALEKTQGKGLDNMFKNVIFNTDELGRCYTAWATNYFSTSPTGTSGSNTNFFSNMGRTKYPQGKQYDSPHDETAISVVYTHRSTLQNGKYWTLRDGGAVTLY